MCRNESATSAALSLALDFAWLESTATSRMESVATCPTAKTMKLMHSQDAMQLAQQRAKNLYPHSPLKQRRYMRRLAEIRGS